MSASAQLGSAAQTTATGKSKIAFSSPVCAAELEQLEHRSGGEMPQANLQAILW